MAKAAVVETPTCDLPVLKGIGITLTTRVEEMFSFRDRALDSTEPEGVHDMRVASRRLRSALRDFSPYLPGRVPQKRLKQLASALGAVRNQDVEITALEKLAKEAEGEVAEGIKAFADERRWRRDRALEELRPMLSDDRSDGLRRDITNRIQKATKDRDGGRAAHATTETSFHNASRQIIQRRLAEFLDSGLSLYYPFKIKELHRARIRAKRFRYAVEMFLPCWSKDLEPFAQEAAELQGALGELHDRDVWIAQLGANLGEWTKLRRDEQEEARSDFSEEPDVRMRAAVWLLQQFAKERSRYYREALKRFDTWESDRLTSRLHEVLLHDQQPLAHRA